MRAMEKLFGEIGPGIQWRRGLARLWVLGTVIWAGLVTYSDGLPSFELYPWEYYQQFMESEKTATHSETEKPVFDPSKPYMVGGWEVVERRPLTKDEFQRTFPTEQAFKAVFPADFDSSTKLKYFCKHLAIYLAKAFGPPIAVFSLGCAFFWAIRGFRPVSRCP